MDYLIIEGFMGSGKGTIAKLVSKKLGLTVVDIDRRISDRLKMNTAEIYNHFGEAYYRAMETLILTDLVHTNKRSVVVLGSGIAMMPQNHDYLKKLGKVYYIKISKAKVLERMKSSKKHAWISAEEWDDQVRKLFEEREPGYMEVADMTIEADDLTQEEIATIIAEDAEAGHHEE